jgi:hypothetical protein
MAVDKRGRIHRGGKAGFIGVTYERLFAVSRVLNALRVHSLGSNVRAGAQVKGCYVDDWVEDFEAHRNYFQLRHRKAQRWPSLLGALNAQRAVVLRGRASALHVVVSRPRVARALSRLAARPADVSVVLFPGWLRPIEHIHRAGPSRDALLAACVLPKPTPSDLELLWKEVSFAWENAQRLGALVDVASVARRLAGDVPVRRRWSRIAGWRAASGILRRIRNFYFRIEGGTFFYGTVTGVSGRACCNSSTFKRFLRAVIQQQPRSIDAVLELL